MGMIMRALLLILGLGLAMPAMARTVTLYLGPANEITSPRTVHNCVKANADDFFTSTASAATTYALEFYSLQDGQCQSSPPLAEGCFPEVWLCDGTNYLRFTDSCTGIYKGKVYDATLSLSWASRPRAGTAWFPKVACDPSLAE